MKDFNIPDFRGRVAVGKDSSQSEFDAIAKTGGEKTHTLSVNEMPAHNHAMRNDSEFSYGPTAGSPNWPLQPLNYYGPGNPAGLENKAAIKLEGDNVAHNNLQPYAVINCIIKY
jgi:microcystin-dependent protein